MKICSWNVNGIRACSKKGFLDWFHSEKGDIICLQETKAFPDQLEEVLRYPLDYHSYWHNGTKKGYSGVVTYSKKESHSVQKSFVELPKTFEQDGRFVQIDLEEFSLLNIYFPNGNPKASGEEMLGFKLDFYSAFLKHLNSLRSKGRSIIACGDYNIAHNEKDIAHPVENQDSIGFLPIEREWMDRIIKEGYIDVFRQFHPNKEDQYTWWSYRTRARERNIGWRIDYFFISPDLLDRVLSVYHQVQVLGSDHCPIVLELDL